MEGHGHQEQNTLQGQWSPSVTGQASLSNRHNGSQAGRTYADVTRGRARGPGHVFAEVMNPLEQRDLGRLYADGTSGPGSTSASGSASRINPPEFRDPRVDRRGLWTQQMERLKASTLKNPSASRKLTVALGIQAGAVLMSPSSVGYSLLEVPTEEQQVVALDCEMVVVTVPHLGKNVHKAAHVCVVDSNGNVVYQTYISQKYRIQDYCTKLTGIKKCHLDKAPPLEKVQNDLHNILAGSILVGHDLQCDLKSLEMEHPVADQRDTQAFFRRNLPLGETKSNLRLMSAVHLNRQIQNSSHDPLEDALASMDLYLLYRDEIDAQHLCPQLP